MTTTDTASARAAEAAKGSSRIEFRAPRQRTPTVLQMEAVECGAAALGIVLAHYGRWVPLEELRVSCGVTRDGSRASNVVRAARTYGLEGKGMRMEPRDLGAIKLPTIAFWGFNHFLTIEGASARGVFVNDPAGGPRLVPWDEFDLSFTGVVLALEPGPDFVRGGSKPSLVQGLAKRLRGATNALSLCLLAGLGLIFPGLALPVFLRVFVDRYLAPTSPHGDGIVLGLIGALALSAVIAAALTWIQQLTLVRLSTKLALSMSGRFFEHLLRLPIPFFQQRYAGTLVTRVNVNDEVASLLSSEFATALLQVITVVFYAVLMFVYSPVLAGVTICFGLANLVVLRSVARRRTDANRRIVLDAGKMTSTAMGGIQNIETVKAIGEENGLFGRWAGHQAKVTNARQELGVPTAIVNAVPTLLAMLNTIVILGFGGLEVIRGALSLGTLAAFQSLSANFNAPITQLVGLGNTVQEMEGKLASVDDVLNYGEEPMLNIIGGGPPLALEAPARRRRGKLSGQIELRDISFGYDPFAPPLITDFNLVVEPGQRVAIVGPSGSGKSTVAKMLCGLYPPWSGEILFDAMARNRIPRSLLAASLALVDQEITLFEGTVRDNLTLWDPTITEAMLLQASRDAVIHDDVVKRVGGFDRLILEGGKDWSGGQRQRLEIARALAGNPTMMVLDEATSALDAIVEEQIDRALRARGCTCVIIAHRLSTIRDADEIIVLEHGHDVERGTHDELIDRGGVYSRLVGE